MKTNLLIDYAELRQQIENLEAERRDMEQKILKDMDKDQVETASYPFGTFSKTHRVRWEYSEKVKKLIDDQKLYLDAAKTSEEESGEAKKSETIGLSFYKPKNES